VPPGHGLGLAACAWGRRPAACIPGCRLRLRPAAWGSPPVACRRATACVRWPAACVRWPAACVRWPAGCVRWPAGCVRCKSGVAHDGPRATVQHPAQDRATSCRRTKETGDPAAALAGLFRPVQAV